jgi:isochorismate pyruvate lyase
LRPQAAGLPDLAAVRAGIDAIDGDLLRLLAERQAHVDRATELKAAAGVSAAAPSRAAAVLAGVRAKARAAGFDPAIAEAMWTAMIAGFVAREEHVLGRGGLDG